MGYREELIELVKEYIEDNIDITDNWSEWEEFLTKQGYIRTYQQVYDMDLEYLISNKDNEYWNKNNEKWDVESLITNDNDITKMENGCYFVHCHQYIDEYIIDLFYEQQEQKEKQKALDWAIAQAYKDLDESVNGFNKVDALLFIAKHDFGNTKLYFASDIKKVKRELLECFKKILELINDAIDDGSVELWLPNHNMYSNEEDKHYCELIKFGGYEVLEDGQTILKSDAIILKDEENIHTLDFYTYQNMHHLCNYIEELFKFYKKDCSDIGDEEYEQEINEELNRIVDYYWKNGKIDFDYAEFNKYN